MIEVHTNITTILLLLEERRLWWRGCGLIYIYIYIYTYTYMWLQSFTYDIGTNNWCKSKSTMGTRFRTHQKLLWSDLCSSDQSSVHIKKRVIECSIQSWNCICTIRMMTLAFPACVWTEYCSYIHHLSFIFHISHLHTFPIPQKSWRITNIENQSFENTRFKLNS